MCEHLQWINMFHGHIKCLKGDNCNLSIHIDSSFYVTNNFIHLSKFRSCKTTLMIWTHSIKMPWLQQLLVSELKDVTCLRFERIWHHTCNISIQFQPSSKSIFILTLLSLLKLFPLCAMMNICFHKNMLMNNLCIHSTLGLTLDLVNMTLDLFNMVGINNFNSLNINGQQSSSWISMVLIILMVCTNRYNFISMYKIDISLDDHDELTYKIFPTKKLNKSLY